MFSWPVQIICFSGFQNQLKLWALLKFNLNPQNKNYRIFQLKHNVFSYNDISPSDSEFGYKCGKCRQVLFYSNDLLPHQEEWWDELREPCSLGLVVLPLIWMEPSLTETRLLCFKCKNKLGCVALRSSVCCPCSALIYPGILINPTKVDKYKLI